MKIYIISLNGDSVYVQIKASFLLNDSDDFTIAIGDATHKLSGHLVVEFSGSHIVLGFAQKSIQKRNDANFDIFA